MKKHKDINNYWLTRFYFLEEDIPTCFVCGKKRNLEKCHLVARAFGGSDEIGNLVLLCHEHHTQAPNIKLDKDIMLKWIDNEARKYERISQFKCDDIENMMKSLGIMRDRLCRVLNNENYLKYIPSFITEHFKDNILEISSHPRANKNSQIVLLEHLAIYKNLEADYFDFILKSRLKEELSDKGVVNDK
jgi:hypothetical protein